MRILRVVPVFLLFLMHPCVGQSNGNAPLVLELPASTRALGLGGAFVLSTAESDAIFYNPGALVNADGVGLAAQRYRSSSTLGTFSAATEWFGGTLSLGVQAISYGSMVPWLDGIPDDANALLVDLPVGVTELVGSVGYGREIFGFRVGIVGKAIEQRVGSGRGATAAADVGIVRRIKGITFGLSVQNVGPKLTNPTGELPLPTRVTVGASTPSRPIGPFDVLATTAVSRRRDGEIVPSGGLEIAWWPIVGRTCFGRVGVLIGHSRSPHPPASITG